MESTPPKIQPLSKKNLETYAVSYIGAYLNTVQKERPGHLPVLARIQPCEIEISVLPNNCFVILFDKGEKQVVKVSDRDWGDIESRVMSGVTHFVAVYIHEGNTVADAISRGKRDAIRDIRSIEDSDIAKALVELEKILGSLSSILVDNKDVLKLGEFELSKLQPIREAIMTSGPQLDMLAMLDALKNYTPEHQSTGIEMEDKLLLEDMVKELGDLSDVIRRVEAADEKLSTMEESTKKAISELSHTIDERINKGLAVILSSTDKKIDKGLLAVQDAARKEVSISDLPKDLEVRLERLDRIAAAFEMESVKPLPPQVINLPNDLELRLNRLEQIVDKVETHFLSKPDVSAELVAAIADLRDNIAKINSRIIKIEEFLVHVTVRQRVVKDR
jgi:ribosomal protein S20